MTCEQIRTEIARQVTGDAAAEPVAAHLASCEACRTYLAETRELWKKLEPLKMEHCPVGLSQQALTQALQDGVSKAARNSGGLAQWPVLDYAVVAAAAILLIATVMEFSNPGPKHSGPEPMRGIVAGDGKEEIKGTPENKADEIRAALTALLTKLSDDNFDARQHASQELEAYVRKSGQPAYDALVMLQPAWDKNADAESKAALGKILFALTSPTLQWVEQTGENSFQSPAPVVIGGTLLQCSEQGLFALDAQTGKKLWSQGGDFDHNIPVVIDDIVVVCGRKGTFAYKLKDGSELWNGTGMTQVSAATDGELIYVPTGKALIAYSRDGHQVWSIEHPGLVDPSVHKKLGLVFVPAWNSSLLAVNAKSGQLVWEQELKGIEHRPPTVTEDRVYVNSGPHDQEGAVVCFDASTGKMVWTGTIPDEAPAEPEGEVASTSSVTGSKSVILGGRTQKEHPVGSPVVTADNVIVQGNRWIFAFNKKDGSLLWKVPCKRFGYTACALVDGRLYAGSDTGDLLAVKASTGALEWKANLNALASKGVPTLQVQRNGVVQNEFGTTGQPIVVGSTIYVTSESGATFAIRLPQLKRAEIK